MQTQSWGFDDLAMQKLCLLGKRIVYRVDGNM
jgi:hypothetical protein